MCILISIMEKSIEISVLKQRQRPKGHISAPWASLLMEMQAPHRLCSEVPQATNIPGDKSGRRENTEELSERKRVEILTAEYCPDHIHMLV